MRILPQTIKEVLQSDYAQTHDIAEITLPAQVSPPYPETTLYLATADNVYVNGQYYTPTLRTVSSIKFSLGRAPDNAEITIENVSRSLGFVLTDTQRVFAGAKVVIKKAFKINDGSFETYTIFVGSIRDIKVNQETIELSIVSDMNKPGTSVAGRTITQRCIWIFNKNGSGVGPQCGWQTSQPGNPLLCDYGLDTPDGCKSHANTHRFGGVPAFTTISTAGNGYDPNNPWPISIDDNVGWCVTPDTYILCYGADKKMFWRKAKRLNSGDTLVSIDKSGKLVKAKLVGMHVGHSNRLYTFTTRRGFGLQCSPSHPIMQGFGHTSGQAAYLFKPDDKVLVYRKGFLRAMEDRIKSIEVADIESNVILLKLEAPYHTFVSANSNVGGVVSHNLKPEPGFGNYPISAGIQV